MAPAKPQHRWWRWWRRSSKPTEPYKPAKDDAATAVRSMGGLAKPAAGRVSNRPALNRALLG